ncbi:MAG: hypothetical protein KGJ62_12715 [Armatimonadetes bacterium]|nr:hypothetical protein [Armatimonadota bacterium]MDE2207806.1 hypothetical protein [Armatimonadota bacterium]
MSQDHPRTDPRTLATLQVDWDEATNELAQDLSDSINRLPPLLRGGTRDTKARKVGDATGR